MASSVPSEGRRSRLAEQRKSLPDGPGVYLFRDERGTVVYVGKAISLRKRVASHFSNPVTRGAYEMVDAIDSVDFVLVSSETEALLVEQSFIKQYQPRFNIRLRDDKSYPFIAVSLDEPYPRVYFTRERHRRGRRYFGPYSSAKRVRSTLDQLGKVFRFRTCTGSEPGRSTGSPCLDFHIDRCTAPCVDEVSREQYREQIDGVVAFLAGRYREIETDLEDRMHDAAAAREYERAAKERNRLTAVRSLLERQRVAGTGSGSLDAVAVSVDGDDANAQVFQVREGVLADRHSFYLQGVVAELQAAAEAGEAPPGPVAATASSDAVAAEDPTARGPASSTVAEPATDDDAPLAAALDDPGAAVDLGAAATGGAAVEDGAAATDGGAVEDAAPVEDGAIAGAEAADALAGDPAEAPTGDDDPARRPLDAGLAVSEVVEQFLLQYYAEGVSVPPVVLVQDAVAGREALEEALRERRGAKVEVLSPQRGDRRKILDLAARNAQLALGQERLKAERRRQQRVEALDELEAELALDQLPVRIECFDVSHTMGTEQVASMVVFEGGAPTKSDYRRFRVRGNEEGRSDDFAAMNEVLGRRLRRYEEESARSPHDPDRDASFAALPSLIVIDGGKGQLSAGVAALEGFRERGVAVVSLAKRIEEVFLPGRERPVVLAHDTSGLQLLQRVRDEAHRFAITHHRGRRDRSMTMSMLDGLVGVGPSRKKALLTHFGSPDSVVKASREELAAVPGIRDRLASEIHAQLHRTGH